LVRVSYDVVGCSPNFNPWDLFAAVGFGGWVNLNIVRNLPFGNYPGYAPA